LAWYWYLLFFAVAALGTAITVPFAIQLAKRFDVIDYPDGRRVNTKPVPRLGGIALFVGILLAIIVFVVLNQTLSGSLSMRGFSRHINYPGVLIALFVIFAVGVLDDFFEIKALYKFVGQIVAACIAAASGLLISHITNPLGGEMIQLGIVAYPVTVFYLVAFANIINLIDGLDGLASGITAISAASLFAISLESFGVDAALLAIILIGACVAFLFFNFYPAKIFMGDSGSLVLGFALGLVSLFGVMRTPAVIALLIPVVIAGIPVIDTLAAIIRRIRAGKSIAAPDAEHMHHRFIDLGFSQRITVFIMYGLSAILAFFAFIVTEIEGPIRFLVLILLALLIIFLVWRLGLMQSVLSHHYNKRAEKPEDRIE
jgi:UDP-GlcNAc:undecaprenyl-phosphate GlcNAc-1-phosphate transferase